MSDDEKKPPEPIDIFALGAEAPKPTGPGRDADGSIAIDELVADAGYVHKSWQTEAPRDLFGGNKPPVTMSPDLARVLSLPRRPKVEPESAEAHRLVAWAMSEFSLPPRPDCTCAEIDPQRAATGRACITSLKFVQAWALHEIRLYNGLLGIITVGGGKCLEADTEVLDYATGTRRTVAERGTLRVAAFDRSLAVYDAEAFPQPQKRCVGVRLADGSRVNASVDHPILTPRGWIHAGQLEPGRDFVAVAAEMPNVEKPTHATDDEVSLVGLLLGDGSCNSGTPGFTNADPSVIEEFQRCAESLGMHVTEDASRSAAREFNLVGAGPVRSANGRHGNGFRERWDLYGLAREKRMHPMTWGLPRAQVALLLNRFYACDGHVSDRSIELTLASEALIDDVRFLLLRLGVRSRKAYKIATCNGENFDAWRLQIRGADAERFLAEVGDVLGKEQACRAMREMLARTPRNTNVDVVPIGLAEIMEICDELGFPRRGDPYRNAPRGRTAVMREFGVTAGQYLSRAAFRRLCDQYEYRGKYAHLATTAVAWERVESVTDRGMRDVYDLSVPGPHNFVANGIIVHNTIIGLLAPLALRQCQKAVLIVPPTLVGQLKREYLLLQQHFRVPQLRIHGTEPWQIDVPGAPTLRVLPYSMLSRPSSTEWLEHVAPDFIIADEADKLSNPDSATTSRVLRYFQAHESTTRFAGWSGSITDDHLADYWHLSALALREGSPLPLDPIVVDDWGRAVDPSDWPAPPGALLQLCDARDESDDDAETVREGYYRRLTETPGVVSSTGAAISTPLVINERTPPAMPNVPRADPRAPTDLYPDGQWPGLLDCLRKVRSEKIRPDGEEMIDPLEWTRCAQQLACGFFYRWRFPRGESEELIKAWKKARKEWRRELRKKLSNRMPHLDSEHLGELAAMRGWGDKPQVDGLPSWKAETWPAWREIRASVYHETETILLDDFLARDAAEWGRTHRGVIWYETKAFGAWVARLSGLTLHVGGPDAGKRLARETGKASIIASISSHGRGRDGLQRIFCDQLVAMPPSSSSRWEQLLGRLSREGQPADEVRGEVYAHTQEFRRSIAQALRRAAYVEGTVGAAQKILASMSLDLQGADASDDEATDREWLEWRGEASPASVW